MARVRVPLLLLLLTTFVAALHLYYLLPFLSSPNDTTIPESQTVYVAHQFAAGNGLYPDFHQYPYNIAPYTPLYYLLLGWTSRFMNADAESMFFIGRCISLFCAVAIGVSLFCFGLMQNKNRASGVVAGCLFISSYILWPWAVSARSDLTALLLTAAGVLLYVCNRDQNWRKSIFPALFFLLAFLTKQSYVIAPCAVLLDLLLRKQKQQAYSFAAMMALPAVLILSIMHSLTDGLSTSNIIFGNVAPMRIASMRLLSNQFLQYAPLALILAALGFQGLSWRHPLSLYWIVSLGWSLFTSSKTGSNINYFLEPLLASCFLVPKALDVLSKNLTSRIRPAFSALFVVLMIPPLNFLLSANSNPYFRQSPSILKIVREANGPVLTDNSRFAFYGPDSFLVDPYQLSFLESSGRWSSGEIQQMLQEKRIQWIILRNPLDKALMWQGVTRIPAGIIEKAKSMYILDSIIDGYYVYQPRESE